MNQLVITASISETGAMRFTPAGLPALDLRLEHESEAEEAGQMRQVSASVKAVAFGSVAERIGRQEAGSDWKFSGFVATPKNGKHMVFHIQDFGPEST
ncbi:MAG: primosomal replication protein N [Burkholderiales bacterium]